MTITFAGRGLFGNGNTGPVAKDDYGTTEIYARVSTRHAWIEKTMNDAPASNRTWFGPVWTDVLPDTPNAAPARAFLKAVRGDLTSMRAFRLAWRTPQFLQSRPEEKHVEREEIWLRDFGKAKLEGYSADGDRRFAIFLSTPDEKWHSFAMDLEGSKIAGVYVNEIMVPRPKKK